MKETKPRLFSSDFILAMAASLGTGFVTYFFFSTLSLLADKLTGTAAYAGYLSMAYSIAAMLSRPIAGMMSDRRGRVVTLIVGSAICAVACLMYSFANRLAFFNFSAGLVMLLAVRALNGIGFSLNNTSSGAIVPDITPKERLSEGVGLFGMTFTLAQAIGPTIALAIVRDGEMSSFNTLFYLSTAICVVSLISACLIKYERNAKKERVDRPVREVAKKADEPVGKTLFGVELNAYGPAIITMLLFFGMCSVLFFLTLYGKNREFDLVQLGWFFAVSAVGIAAARIFLSKIVDKRGPDIVLIPGFIVVVLTLFLIPLVDSTLLLICLGLPYGVSTGAVLPPLNTIMFNRCSPNKRGAVFAAYAMAMDIGITLGSLVLGLVADNISFNFVFWLSAAVHFVALLLYVFRVSDRCFNKRQRGLS